MHGSVPTISCLFFNDVGFLELFALTGHLTLAFLIVGLHEPGNLSAVTGRGVDVYPFLITLFVFFLINNPSSGALSHRCVPHFLIWLLFSRFLHKVLNSRARSECRLIWAEGEGNTCD